jgi:hypothetical protein
MAKRTLYTFNKAQSGVLARIANSYSLRSSSSTVADGSYRQYASVGAWIMEATSEITAATYDESTTGVTPGEGTAKIKELSSDNTILEDHLAIDDSYTECTVKSLAFGPIPEGSILLVMRTQDQQLWVVEWLNRPVGSFVAKTGATPISAREDNTPGEGDVDLYRLNPDTGELEVYKEDVHVYSWVSSESGAYNWVYVGYDVFGTLWFENEDCGSL